MATDRTESTRRGQSAVKTTQKEAYAAIEHRVIESPAFAALRPSAVLLLLLMARQLSKDNNGHLHAAFKWCSKFGIGSEHTLQGAIAQLIAHGFIYRTRSQKFCPSTVYVSNSRLEKRLPSVVDFLAAFIALLLRPSVGAAHRPLKESVRRRWCSKHRYGIKLCGNDRVFQVSIVGFNHCNGCPGQLRNDE